MARKKSNKRAFSITTGEVSAMFWIIGFVMIMVGLRYLFEMQSAFRELGNESLVGTTGLVIFLIFFFVFFSLLSMAFPNYQITKNDLNIFIDRITNPDFIGWGRITRNKRLRVHTVDMGPSGQTKGIVNGEKADVFNFGDYTVTTKNGNQIIFVNDWLNTNINFDDVRDMNLIKRHFGIVGFNAWKYAANKKQLLTGLEEIVDEEKTEEGNEEVGHEQSQ